MTLAFAAGAGLYLVASIARWPRSWLAVGSGLLGLAALVVLAAAGGTRSEPIFASQLVLAALALGAVNAGMLLGHTELREGTVDKAKARLIDRDDMLANTMSTFVSLTVHCARCHDHKFDPIPQHDYYRLQAVFAGVDRGDRPYPDRPAAAPMAAAPRKASGRHARKGTPARCISSTVMYPPTMAKAPWARLMKFISPMVTASPRARMNSSMP